MIDFSSNSYSKKKKKKSVKRRYPLRIRTPITFKHYYIFILVKLFLTRERITLAS